MTTFYFYCPKCGYQVEDTKLPQGTVSNCRDGWGIPIHHYECSECHNLDAGYMREIDGTLDEKVYYRSVIGLYQNIRGIKQ